jgi:long-chain acyl-CoA synthetase
VTPATLNDLYFEAAARYGKRPVVMRIKRDGHWQSTSWPTLHASVRQAHAALRELGLSPGERIGILSENRPEWAITDFGCLAARLVDVPIYPTLPARQMQYILHDAGVRVLFVSSLAQLEKILQIRAELPALTRVVLFDDAPRPEGVESFREFLARGAQASDRYPEWEAEARRAQPGDLATLIYTSGTTGNPKGVMLSHGNITSNVVSSLSVLDIRDRDECLSFLPLSHIFERMVGHYVMVYAGVQISYATSNDTVAAELVEVRPTVLASVPRLYEKIYARVVEGAMSAGGPKRAIFEWARATGEKYLEYTLVRQRVPLGLVLGMKLADALVFSKLRARTGGRIRMMVSGGAPLNPEICRFFIAANLVIYEGYGLTETSPVITVNTPAMHKPGTVGRPIPGVEVKIANDGEILTRGPHVMQGYYNLPGATDEAIDADRWFHTGDIGEIDSEGCLRITDRKKDLIVTAGGKNIAPQPIEGLLKTNKFFTNAVMLGDKRKFPIMMLVPNFPVLGAWLTVKGLPKLTPEKLILMPEVQDKLAREARKSFRDLAQFETPKKFLLLAKDFTIEAGELTPKQSIRRRVVEERYKEQIEELYREEE